MSQVLQLWLPIVVTAVAVFIASSLIHNVFKWHNSDYMKLGNEDEVRAAVRANAPAPGQYIMPHIYDMKEMQTESIQQKYREGPIAFLTVKANGDIKMGGALSQWFVLNMVIATVAAMLALQMVGLQGGGNRGGQLVGMFSFFAYGCGGVQAAIWMGKPWGSAAKDVIDALIYGTVSALAFTWLWP